MPARPPPPASAPAPAFLRKRPAYVLIGQLLQGAIEAGRLPAGAVLLESALAEMFGASRSPIKQAFAMLEEAGLVRRFGGRGVVVGSAVPDRRIAVTPGRLGLGDAPAEVRDDAWTTLYYHVERDLILCSLFGRFRINEVALARHFGVGRTVARNLLVQAQSVGLLDKGGNAQWQVVPLDRARIEHLYDLRLALEPPLLRAAVGRIAEAALDAMEARCVAAARAMPDVDVATLDALEVDLHVACLAASPNTEMAEALRRTRCLLVVGKHVQTALPGGSGIDPFMDEHLSVLRSVRAGDSEAACRALQDHLLSSKQKAIQRLSLFGENDYGKPPSYFIGQP